MLTARDEEIIRNFDKYLAQATVTDPALAQKSATQEGALGPEYKGHIDERGLLAALGSDFTLITPDGKVQHRNRLIGSLHGGDPTINYKSGKIETLTSNDTGDTAWMTGTLVIQGAVNGVDISGNYRTSGVFAKRNGQWQQVLMHLAPYR